MALMIVPPGSLCCDRIDSHIAWWRKLLVKIGLKRFAKYDVTYRFTLRPN